MNMQNAATLAEARRNVAEFERASELSTIEMLACGPEDKRLATIDPFDLMDWHYAIEQIKVLEQLDVKMPIFEASACRASSFSAFRYKLTTTKELVNAQEPELLLVA